ncbi:MAG: hypothetical protein ACI8TX_002219 [Hyphomicrobiaceae bacterium]|jgi:hypothetical protein
MTKASQNLRFILPLLCVSMVAIAAACSNGSGGSSEEMVDLPMLAVACDWGNGAGQASDCGTSASIQAPTITARVKEDGAVCNGEAAGTLALGVSAASCYFEPNNACVGTIAAWTTPDGGDPLTELESGDYLADIHIDTDNSGTVTGGDAVSCTDFTLEDGLDTVTSDFWMDFAVAM